MLFITSPNIQPIKKEITLMKAKSVVIKKIIRRIIIGIKPIFELLKMPLAMQIIPIIIND